MLRILSLLALILGLSACGGADLKDPPPDLGNFLLGHNVVVAPNLTKGPLSREASKEEWIAAMTKAVQDRLGPTRYDGEKYYHIGISVEGYVLAQPGLPVVLSPKSALIINVTLWDDASGAKVNDEPQQITVSETLSGETVIGSGLTRTKEQQMENLAHNAALAIERWLVKNRKWLKD